MTRLRRKVLFADTIFLTVNRAVITVGVGKAQPFQWILPPKAIY
jgi:hypothetical protein